jgi:hypothetical protein
MIWLPQKYAGSFDRPVVARAIPLPDCLGAIGLVGVLSAIRLAILTTRRRRPGAVGPNPVLSNLAFVSLPVLKEVRTAGSRSLVVGLHGRCRSWVCAREQAQPAGTSIACRSTCVVSPMG